MRHDLAWQSAIERTQELASSPTLCRLEQRADRPAAVAFHEVLLAQFIASFAQPPTELILDFDATDDRVHGHQEGRHFHGYYGDYCFLPLYVFCGEQLLVSYLRRSHIDAAQHAWAILKLLVQGLRRAWPKGKIILRGDSGFCRWRMLRWCENAGVYYLVGLAKNSRLEALAAPLLSEAEAAFAATGQKQRVFGWLDYAAGTWDKARRVIAKAEHSEKGKNPRYLVTNLAGDAQALYAEIYCARGEMEPSSSEIAWPKASPEGGRGGARQNRIKEQQLGLFADRTSCQGWWGNQFRLLLSSAAYTLMETVRRVALAGTELARAQVGTIRLRLLKIEAVITRNTRRIRLLLGSGYPCRALFAHACAQLSSSA